MKKALIGWYEIAAYILEIANWNRVLLCSTLEAAEACYTVYRLDFFCIGRKCEKGCRFLVGSRRNGLWDSQEWIFINLKMLKSLFCF